MNNQFNNNFSQQGNSNNAQIFQPSYMQPKTQPVQQPINNNYINTQNNKSKNSKKVILIFLAILIIILCVIAFFYLKKDKNKNLETDITSSNVFFIKNEDNKYALFNDDGEQLTEFIFTSIDDFVNGTSLVRKDDAYGIIDSKGNMTVDFGTYSYIRTAGGLYKVHGEDYHYLLIDGTGKVLYDLEDNNLDTFIGEYYSILEEKSTNTYKVLDYQGKVMTSFPIVENVKDDPTTSEKDGYISVYYNNKNFILNENTGKEVISFNADKHYCVRDVEEDGNLILLSSCVSWFQSQDKVYYKLIKNGKLYDITDTCNSVYYENNNLVCTFDYKKYLLDNNLKVGIDIDEKIYVDNSTYAQNKDGSFNGVDFYIDGKVVKNVSCRNIKYYTGYSEYGLYVLETYYSKTCGTSDGVYEFYNSKGEKVFGKLFESVKKFDKNGVSIVSDDERTYYLIDTSGKKISENFDVISPELDIYYKVTNKDKKNGIIDNKGNKILDCKYSKIEIKKILNKYYALLTTDDSKYILYDLDKKMEVLNLEQKPSLNEHYVSIVKDNKSQYYTYSGKLFYEL